ncbi:MAG: signal recognition particle-docking protein FtsY [Candidatus Tectomicrobia bacterium]|uniref:Signal recognition particle receptor FtsY n=1 Tax=Tectimicrobiota bacterium TaxID=2528274 RepID=A0A932CRB9_UNCTE|nr:signal recognition particle-docking protein FtsY [Candidatus Tectomicrobia bacterium]
MRLPFFSKKEKAPKPAEEAVELDQPGTAPEGREEAILEEEEALPEEASPSLAVEAPEKVGFFRRLKRSLSATRQGLVTRVERVLRGKGKIDDLLLEELEEVLIGADLGVSSTLKVMGQLKEQVARGEIRRPEEIRDVLRASLQEILKRAEGRLRVEPFNPFVIMVIGVNGVGKTTTIGKLAKKFRDQGKDVVLAAGDTFRAAAIDQLEIWSHRARVDLIKHRPGADPAAVVFDAIQSAKARGAQVVIADTAGRLHTQTNLMEELKKIKRVMSREIPQAPHEILLVLDANTGQNSISQTHLFHQALGVTGLVLTKLDGTAKGGVVVNIVDEFGLPIRYIGIGEGVEDLQEFDPEQFVSAIFEGPEEDKE